MMTDNQRHYGRKRAVLANRQELYERMQTSSVGAANWTAAHPKSLGDLGFQQSVAGLATAVAYLVAQRNAREFATQERR